MKAFPKIILLFMAVDWPLYMRRQMVISMAESAKKLGSTVVAVNRPLCPFSTYLTKRHRFSELFGRAKLERLSDNLYRFSPKYFIYDQIANYVPVFERFNIALLRRSYYRLKKRLNIDESNPLIWFNYPQQGYVARLFDKSFSVFELYDYLSDVNGEQSKSVIKLEKKLRRNVNLLVTTSSKLQASYGPNYKKSYMLGNGIDRETFLNLSDISREIFHPISNIQSPRLGYAGMVSDRIDWKLIHALAEREPEWNFIFVGKIQSSPAINRIAQLKNVHFPGEFSHDLVPSLLNSFDVGIMPYRVNEFFDYVNPLKFYEFAAAGLPTVSSTIDELKHHPEQFIDIIPNDPKKWHRALQSKINCDKKITKEIGVNIARNYIWEDMLETLLNKIKDDYL
ncbi:MAG: glycosyltransferase [candidate division Zixibacteria bacterium]